MISIEVVKKQNFERLKGFNITSLELLEEYTVYGPPLRVEYEEYKLVCTTPAGLEKIFYVEFSTSHYRTEVREPYSNIFLHTMPLKERREASSKQIKIDIEKDRAISSDKHFIKCLANKDDPEARKYLEDKLKEQYEGLNLKFKISDIDEENNYCLFGFSREEYREHLPKPVDVKVSGDCAAAADMNVSE